MKINVNKVLFFGGLGIITILVVRKIRNDGKEKKAIEFYYETLMQYQNEQKG